MATTTKDQILGNTNPTPTAPPNGYTRQGGGENVQQGTGDARSGDATNAGAQHNNGGTNTATEGNPSVKQQSTPQATDGSNVAPQTKPQTQQPTSTGNVQQQPQKENNPFPTSAPNGYTKQGNDAPQEEQSGNNVAGTVRGINGMPSAKGGAGGGTSLSYEEMFNQMNPYKPPTPEEVEAEKKKQRRKAMWAAIGDGVSALANLYFVGKGAYDASPTKEGSMSARLKADMDRLQKEREANQERYVNGYLRALKYDRDAANANRAYQHQLDREAYEDERDKGKYKAQEDYWLNRAAGAEEDANYRKARADRERVLADAQQELSDAELEYKKAQTEAQRAAAKARLDSARAQLIRAAKYQGGSGGGRGGSGGKPYGTLTIEGVTHNYKSKADYDKAVSEYAKKYGVSEQEITYEYSNGNTKLGEKRKQRQVHNVAADVEERAKPKPKPKPQQQKPAGTPMSEADKQRFLQSSSNIVAQVNAGMQRTKNRMATPKQPHQQGGKKKTGVTWIR